jgi:flagellar hook assembly protein FlgD
VRFDMPQAGMTELAVYDVSGRLVRQLVQSHLPAGSHVAMWDGTDRDGRRVSNGVYFSYLRANGQVRTGRMVVLMK